MASSFSRKGFADVGWVGIRGKQAGNCPAQAPGSIVAIGIPGFPGRSPPPGGSSSRHARRDLTQLFRLVGDHIDFPVGDAAADLAELGPFAGAAPALQRASRHSPARGKFGLKKQSWFHCVLRLR